MPRNGDGAVRTATTLVNSALGDDFDEKHIGLGRPGADQLSSAVDVGILGLRSLGTDGEFELDGRLAVDLS